MSKTKTTSKKKTAKKAPAKKTSVPKSMDAKRLDWLEEFDSERLEDVRGHINNEGGTVREAIDFFMGQS